MKLGIIITTPRGAIINSKTWDASDFRNKGFNPQEFIKEHLEKGHLALLFDADIPETVFDIKLKRIAPPSLSPNNP